MTGTSGFTLISFILVLVVIGVLAAILIPAVAEFGSSALVNKVKADLRTIKNALEYYNMSFGVFPDIKQNEWEDPGENLLLRMEPRMIDQMPEDPFNPGSGYQYRLHDSGEWFVVYTRGPEGNGTAQFNKKDPDQVTIRNGATTAYVTNARDVILEP